MVPDNVLEIRIVPISGEPASKPLGKTTLGYGAPGVA
jgi:hypothetical protein